ncbi:MAG: extracellular catalytic domain type 2 short-chain-length polyhydroxyalkanoate depolymerase [Hyphomicrobium sp.]
MSPLHSSWTLRATAFMLAAMALWAASGCETQDGRNLPPLATDITKTSVSGISSGAYMAGQFQMAHARLVVGAGIIAGGPYGCSESVFADALPGPGTAFLNLSKAVNGCMLNMLGVWGVADPVALALKAKRRAEEGEIDPIADVVGDRVYLFSGKADTTVVPAIVAAAAKYYKQLGLADDAIKFVDNVGAGHAFVTEDAGENCTHTGDPYIVDCDYDQAEALLSHIYGKLNPRATAAAGRYIAFDQRFFTRGLSPNGMADEGIVYVPDACVASGGCRVHVAYHGCAQSRAKVGDQFVKGTGFARWADTNRLVILFPQAAIAAFNPQACWDWWGYTGPEYLNRTAPQIVAVHRMLEALSSATGRP